jgi:hypothetical protein
MSADTRPHVALAVLISGVAGAIDRGQPPEQTSDQHHDLLIRLMVGAGERLLHVLIPPLGPMPNLSVVQQVLL